MDAVYNLSRAPASFNFLECLVASKTRGATDMLLDNSAGFINKYPPEETAVRLVSIVEPACALAGMPFRYGKAQGDEINTSYHPAAPIDAYNTRGFIAKLVSVKPKADARYTVTLRGFARQHHRNSNRDTWLDFANEIKATVIYDWFEKPIHLHDRMALYAGAEMNFFTNGGPASLCVYSDYPYTLFMNAPATAYLRDNAMPSGYQCPWRTKDQHIVWAEDTYDNIRAAWGLRKAA